MFKQRAEAHGGFAGECALANPGQDSATLRGPLQDLRDRRNTHLCSCRPAVGPHANNVPVSRAYGPKRQHRYSQAASHSGSTSHKGIQQERGKVPKVARKKADPYCTRQAWTCGSSQS
jgi:hypothetical protein